MIIPRYTCKKTRKRTREYKSLLNQIDRAKDKDKDDVLLLRRKLRKTQCSDQFDPEYRRLRYIRYADDFLLGFAGPKDEAEEIKDQLTTFLRDYLKLELSPEKT